MPEKPTPKTAPAKAPANKSEKPASSNARENRNLLILGIGATLLALVTTSVSLYIYHASGDIYLDRSRPGFLPDASDEEEELEIEPTNYKYPDSGPVDQKSLDEYLSRLKEYQKDLSDLPDPYPSHSLSDQSLGITATD